MELMPTYDELKKRVLELEIEAANFKLAEESLRKSNETVTSILGASPIGIGLVENRVVQRVNEAMLKLFRFESDAGLIGQSARILYPSEEEFDRIGQYIYANLQAKEASTDAVFLRKDRTTFVGHLKVNSLTPDSPMTRATFTISDISWRKKAEQELLQKEKLHAVIETAGAVCHELNQPMQVALMEAVEVAQIDEFTHAQIKIKLEKIKEQLDSMRGITLKLMRITRYETRDYVEGERIIDIDKSSGLT